MTDDLASDLRIEITQQLDKPAECKVWRGDVLRFDGVAREEVERLRDELRSVAHLRTAESLTRHTGMGLSWAVDALHRATDLGTLIEERNRAEKAEAAVARVEALRHDRDAVFEIGGAISGPLVDLAGTWVRLSAVDAALRGDQ